MDQHIGPGSQFDQGWAHGRVARDNNRHIMGVEALGQGELDLRVIDHWDGHPQTVVLEHSPPPC